MILTHLTYQDKYAGIKAVGDAKVLPPSGPNTKVHMQRAFYLTTQMEAPVWGCVQSYDGCGMSGGPMHYIGLFPKTMEQGPLFSLLRRIEITPGSPVQPLWEAFKEVGWYVARDGKLRNIKTGGLITGSEIRNTFTPPNGLVPKAGVARKQAEKWATLFYNLLSDPITYSAQADYSIEYLIKSSADTELKAYRLFLSKIESPERIGIEPSLVLPDAVDLAMCVYHSFTPNAPAIARQCLEATLIKVGAKPTPLEFAKVLIKTLGTKSYGRWKDVPGSNGSRYDATRNACLKSKLWTTDLLDATMPIDFK